MKIEVALDSQGEFIKVDKNNLVKTVTIATLRPCIEYEDIVDEISIDDSLQNDMILSIS